MVNAPLSFSLKSVEDGTEIKVNKTVCTVGRDSDCDIVLSQGYPSRQHAQIFEQGGSLFIKDLNSTNGTFVNGQRAYNAMMIRSGDVIKFGAAAFYLNFENPGEETVITKKPSISKPDHSFIVMDEEKTDPNETVIQQEYRLPFGWPADDTITKKLFQEKPSKKRLDKIDQQIQRSLSGDGLVYTAALIFNPNDKTPIVFGISLESQHKTLSIGRSHKCDFTINSLSVSEHHANLSFEQGEWILKDRNSTNGIHVERELKTEIRLKHGSSVLLGQVEMIFREIPWAL